ncbi:non-ribosomal peptide synthetase [Duganella sp. Root1480D1]|uniref:non-ribosomal peptide synthetase n=1 Tax=Duganella sp. Root1480D1 TaxID=1736471 RepID=UPI000709F851|nr:non-ribosomal peptide synthetase [Duganella sp. Root1480D1]KQZ38943.1 hypothetical protein ASD58_27760 [Duganella sp. Root1480D1]
MREAVVVARGDAAGGQRLVAYLTAQAEAAAELLEPATLRQALARRLADYMIPSAFVLLEALPLSANGKLDRKALPAPDEAALAARPYEAPQGEAEQVLAQVWQELLGVERVGRHDHFFELGGHSLLAVQMIAMAAQRMAVEVPVREVFVAPVMADFAMRLAGARVEQGPSVLVPIRAQGDAAPLFFIHPGEGEVGYARVLADHLDPAIPVYGLAACGFERGEVPKATVEEMAADYLAAIRSVQPHGPYRLVGWSAGGTIAYEIATRLSGSDEQVAFLGLIDTCCDYRAGGAMLKTDEASVIGEMLPPALPPELQRQLEAAWRDGDADTMLALCLAHRVLPEELQPDLLRRHLAVRVAIRKAVLGYAPQALPFKPVLFHASEERRADVSLGWRALLGELELHAVPGHHYSMTAEPHAAALAAALSQAMQAAAPRLAARDDAAYAPKINIQRGRAGVAPLFCVPGAGASITAFAQLAQDLDPDLPVYGLQPRGLCGEMTPYADVESAARAYLHTIRQVAPHGPYHLLGHSFGGWVAFEMARQLELAGERVATLVALDTQVPAAQGAPLRFHAREQMLEQLVGLFDLNLERPLGLAAADFAPLAPEAQLELLKSRLVGAGVLPARMGLNVLRGIVQVFAANLNTTYRPAPYGGTLHLALAPDPGCSDSDNSAEMARLADGWRRFAAAVEPWVAPGNHVTLLREPHAAQVAAWLGRRLAAAPACLAADGIK